MTETLLLDYAISDDGSTQDAGDQQQKQDFD